MPPRPLAQAPALSGLAVDPHLMVTGVTLDSRRVRPGDVYAALPGSLTHGARFAEQARQAGAAVVLTDTAGAAICQAADCPIPVITVADPRGILGALSAWVYDDPGEQLLTVGITGTNGKTTMTHLVAAALRAAGHRTGTIGTIGIQVGDRELPSARTTPEAPDVHAVLGVMRQESVTAVVMEVSSHALVLGRVDGLVFDVAAFTNLSQDHLDFHGTLAEYFAAKASLFQPDRSGRAVVCVDDEWGQLLAGQSGVPVVTYGVDAADADWQLVDVTVTGTGRWSGRAVGPLGRSVAVTSPLPGRYNQANVLGSLVIAIDLGVTPEVAADGLADCPGVPGRMEPVAGAGFAAFVDYAHTPDAVARAIGAVREFTSGKVLVALGCGGDRDPGKRWSMGRLAAEGADVVVVTDDNPRSEDPAMIRQTVLAGVRDAASAAAAEIADRRLAIRTLVNQAEDGDCVLILGKGHEQGQEIAGVVTPFDDRVELRAAIAERTRT